MIQPHAEGYVGSASHKRTTKLLSEGSVRNTEGSVDLEHLPSLLIQSSKKDSESSPREKDDRTFVEEPLMEPQGSDGRPREANIKATSKGAKGSLAKFTSFVDLNAPQNTYVMKEEFKTFATNVFTYLGFEGFENLNPSTCFGTIPQSTA